VLVISVNLLLIVVVANKDLEVVKTLVRENPLVTNNQRWMISNFPPKEVMEIKCADHMPMFSKPQEVCALLLEIANKYCKN